MDLGAPSYKRKAVSCRKGEVKSAERRAMLDRRGVPQRVTAIRLVRTMAPATSRTR